jgi:rod shape-determining protein MreC
MFSRKIGSSKNRLKLAYYIIAVFMIILIFRTSIDKVRVFVNMGVMPVKIKIYELGVKVKNSVHNISYFSEIVVQNKELKFELNKNIQLVSKMEELEKENERLRGLLDIKKEGRLDFIAAKISFRDGFSVYNEMYVSKGANDGIKKNMVVLYEKNLLGRVKEVYENASLVELITKNDIYTSVLDQNNKNLSILKGTNSKHLDLEYITIDSEVRVGDEIYTSGLSDIYSKGIYVGRIKEIVQNENHLFKKVVVELPYNIFDVNEVIILK